MSKSLKEKNRNLLWVVIAVNTLLFCAVVQANALRLDDISSLFKEPQDFMPVGLAVLISTVLNGLLTADTKARLVFLRWRHPLPGHRAFTEYAVSDPRVDPEILKQNLGGALPVDPVDQNRTWYRIYKSVEREPAVDQVHRDFLLLRDYAGLSVLFIIVNTSVGLYAISSLKVWAIYSVVLLAQYVLVRQAASHYGVRMVTSVLAQVAAKSSASGLRPRKKRTTKTAERN